jgi:drug/metabolite transporter (DMT)-like permease
MWENAMANRGFYSCVSNTIISPIWLLFAGLLAFGFSNGVVRAIAKTSTVLEVAFWMAAGTVIGIWASSGFKLNELYRLPDPKSASAYIGIQILAFFLFVLAISLGPASLVGAFFPLEAVVGVAIAAVALKERYGLVEILCIGISVLGALVVALGVDIEDHAPAAAVAAALASSVAFGAAIPAVRHASQKNSIRSMAVWYVTICALVTAPIGLSSVRPELLWLFAISCVIKPIAEICYATGLARAPIALAVSCLPLLGLITAFWGWVIVNEVPDKMTIMGGSLIALASIGALLHQAHLTRLRRRKWHEVTPHEIL